MQQLTSAREQAAWKRAEEHERCEAKRRAMEDAKYRVLLNDWNEIVRAEAKLIEQPDAATARLVIFRGKLMNYKGEAVRPVIEDSEPQARAFAETTKLIRAYGPQQEAGVMFHENESVTAIATGTCYFCETPIRTTGNGKDKEEAVIDATEATPVPCDKCACRWRFLHTGPVSGVFRMADLPDWKFPTYEDR